MATDATKILVGAGVVSLGDYVSAGGSGTLTDVGHTKNPVTFAPTFENFEIRGERAFGPIRISPQDMSLAIKVPMMEAVLEKYRIALRQPAANKSGTAPNETLLVGQPAEQYHQLQIVGPGLGTTKVRTCTFWKCIVEAVAEVPFAKAAEQMLDVTFRALFDDSVTTADKFGKIVDA